MDDKRRAALLMNDAVGDGRSTDLEKLGVDRDQ